MSGSAYNDSEQHAYRNTANTRAHVYRYSDTNGDQYSGEHVYSGKYSHWDATNPDEYVHANRYEYAGYAHCDAYSYTNASVLLWR